MFPIQSDDRVIRYQDGHEELIPIFSRQVGDYKTLRITAGCNDIHGRWGCGMIEISGDLSDLIDRLDGHVLRFELRGSRTVDEAIRVVRFILQALEDGRSGRSYND